MLVLIILLPLIVATSVSGTAFHSSSIGGFNESSAKKPVIQVSQALRLPPAMFYHKEVQRKVHSNMPNYESHSQTTPMRARDSTSGGIGLSLTNQNHISLGHLTNPKKATSSSSSSSLSFSSQSASSGSTSGWRAQEISSSQNYPKRSMRVMGKPINPNIVNKLHPDVSSRKIHRLWKMLSGSEDEYWTSEEAPRVLRQRGVSGMMSDSAGNGDASTIVDSALLRKANALNMTFRDQTGAQFLLPETQIQIFRNWLVEQATCEMDFIWKDLGSLYWPRWIRMGVCLSKLGSSCSWPPGMKCQPSGSRVLRLLNWNCEDSLQARDSNSPLKRSSRAVVNMPGGSSLYGNSPMINLRSVLNESSMSRNPYQRRTTRAFSADPMWRYYGSHRKKDRRDVLTPAVQEARKARKAKRLMKKLSVTSSGYHCYWQVQKYLISDKCTCSCA